VTDSIWPTIHAERHSLADDLAALSPRAVGYPVAVQRVERSSGARTSAVGGQDDTCEVLRTFRRGPVQFRSLRSKPRWRSRVQQVRRRRWKRSGSAEPRQTAPPGPKETWLGEAFVHGEDIRRPLGITHAYPLPEVARAVAFYARSNTIIGGKTRVAGVTLNATDMELTVGSGPLAEGPVISLLLAASGRKSALDELSGPGVQLLRSRS